jgi:outer membrane immunogenic protein
MRNLRLQLVATAAVASFAVAAPAYAQLAGGRVELRGGWDSVKLNGEFSTINPVLARENSSSESGFGFGLEAGYDFMVGQSFVAGGYVGYDLSSSDFCAPVFGNDQACLEAGHDWTIGVRAGFPVSANALIYIKGGYSNGKLKASYDDFDGFVTINPPPPTPIVIADFDDSKSSGGVHLGVGGEMNFSSNFYGKIEYVFTNYGNANFDGTNVHLGLDATRHKVFFGAGFRF